jgi:hypothetical protein
MVTKESISQLMDDELEGADAARALSALRDEAEGRQVWRTYHLIGDALRDTRMLSQGFSERVAARLAEEPTVLAPAASAPAARPWRTPFHAGGGRPRRCGVRRLGSLFWCRLQEPSLVPQPVAQVRKCGPRLLRWRRTCPRAACRSLPTTTCSRTRATRRAICCRA